MDDCRIGSGPHAIDDWLAASGRRTELIDGQLIAHEMPSGVHQWACDELCSLFKTNVRWGDRDHDLYPVTGVGIEISAHRTVLIPDVVILNAKPDGRVFAPDQVELVAEVWSPSESTDDRSLKFDLYAQAEFRYVWTVDLDGPAVNAYEYLGDNWYRQRETLRGREIDRMEAAPVPVSIQPMTLLPRLVWPRRTEVGLV